MATRTNIHDFNSLPEAIKRKTGIGTSRIKVIQHEDGEIVARATQGLEEVTIKLTQVKGDKARTIELTERELHRIDLPPENSYIMT